MIQLKNNCLLYQSVHTFKPIMWTGCFNVMLLVQCTDLEYRSTVDIIVDKCEHFTYKDFMNFYMRLGITFVLK